MPEEPKKRRPEPASLLAFVAPPLSVIGRGTPIGARVEAVARGLLPVIGGVLARSYSELGLILCERVAKVRPQVAASGFFVALLCFVIS